MQNYITAKLQNVISENTPSLVFNFLQMHFICPDPNMKDSLHAAQLLIILFLWWQILLQFGHRPLFHFESPLYV